MSTVMCNVVEIYVGKEVEVILDRGTILPTVLQLNHFLKLMTIRSLV